MDLTEKKCVPCEGGVAAMAQGQACSMLPQVPGWELAGNVLTRTFKFKNFLGSMAFVNRVAELAEAEAHHPDIHVSWNKVTLSLTTHAIGGLSENDFILAAKINDLL
ncbi:MAG: 4a-hydroxytetrahydrobiopterin dehydratase [Phycisphaerae bacterium]|nr:4a-hydroxytetrahydrobiopterin dehydratase [Phycisphaerae bacterium]